MKIYVGTVSNKTVYGFNNLIDERIRNKVRWNAQTFLNDLLEANGKITFGDVRKAFGFSAYTMDPDKVVVEAKNTNDFVDVDFINLKYCESCGILESYDVVLIHED